MEHSQFKLIYYPKKDKLNIWEWVSTGVDLYSYLDFNCQESTEKKQDGGNLPFIKKKLVEDIATYNSGTRTFTITKTLDTNKYRWHTLVDSHNNRFVIESNTGNTITLGTKAPVGDFNWYANPVAGKIVIELPDFEEDDIFVIYGWKILNNVYSEPADFADKVMFVGQVVTRQIKNDNRGTQILLKLANTTELLLKTTENWVRYAVTQPTFIDKIQSILDEINRRNKGSIQISLAPETLALTQTTQGEAFIEKDYYKDNCSAADAIYDLCTTPNTGDVVDYYVLVLPAGTNTYYLKLMPKLITAFTDIYEGVDFDFLEWSNDKMDAISHIIYRCGRDCNNNNVTQVVTGSFKKGSRGYRMAEDLAGNILKAETYNNPSDFNIEVNKFPTLYPYTTATAVSQQQVDALGPTHYSSYIDHTGTYTITSNSEFNRFIKYLAKADAIIKAKAFLALNNKTRDKIVVEFYATPAAQIPGDTSRFNIPTIGWNAPMIGGKDYRKKLRLSNKKVSVNTNGISIVGEYIEDEKDAII